MKKVTIRPKQYESIADAERRVVIAAFMNWEHDPTLKGVKAVIAVMTDANEKALAKARLISWFANNRDEQRVACLEGKNKAFNRFVKSEVKTMSSHPGFTSNSPF